MNRRFIYYHLKGTRRGKVNWTKKNTFQHNGWCACVCMCRYRSILKKNILGIVSLRYKMCVCLVERMSTIIVLFETRTLCQSCIIPSEAGCHPTGQYEFVFVCVFVHILQWRRTHKVRPTIVLHLDQLEPNVRYLVSSSTMLVVTNVQNQTPTMTVSMWTSVIVNCFARKGRQFNCGNHIFFSLMRHETRTCTHYAVAHQILFHTSLYS